MPSANTFLPIPTLRLLDPDQDAEALHAVFGDPASCRFLPRPAQATVDDTRTLLRQWTDGYEDTSWVTVDALGRATARIALYAPQPGVWEAACMVVPAARGQGLALRALPHALDWVFTHKRPRRIAADVDPDNVASLRTFERLGFQVEGRLRASWATHIGIRDSIVLSLLPGDPRPWRVAP